MSYTVTSLDVYTFLFLFCTSGIVLWTIHFYSYATPLSLFHSTQLGLWCYTVNYMQLLFYSTPLRLYTTLSCYIFLYAFSAVRFLCLYACSNRNLTTAKLDVCTVLHYAFLLYYIFNCTVPLRRNLTGNANGYTTGTRTRTERVKNGYRMDIEQIRNGNGSEKGKKHSGMQTIRECVLQNTC